MADTKMRKTGENPSFKTGENPSFKTGENPSFKNRDYVSTHTSSGQKRLVVTAPSRFTFEWQEEFRASFTGKQMYAEFVIDFRNTDYIDSSGLGMLLVLLELVDNKPVRLINTKTIVRKILQIANFESLFSIE